MKRRIFSVMCGLLMVAGELAAQNSQFDWRYDAYADLRADSCKITQTSLNIEGSMGEMMGYLYTPYNVVEKPPVIICSHGFGGAFTLTQPVAKYFASQGFAAYCYSFCGGGPNNGSAGTMTDMSVLTEAVDLNNVIDYFKNAGYSKIFSLWRKSGWFCFNVCRRRTTAGYSRYAAYLSGVCDT